MKNKFFVLTAVFLLTFCRVAVAYERITSFDSFIQAQYDGSLIITEKITVYHEGKQIRRGIYRDLPTKKGEQYELIEVFRNGYPEPNFVEKRRGYYRINTGDDRFLSHPGVSEFTIKYQVFNVPKSYDGYDEIYWNVTGDKWAFPIEKVQATLQLPSEAAVIQQASYVGKKGSKNAASYLGNNTYYADNLNPGEQLTIAVGFTPHIINTSKHFSENSNDFKPLLWAYLGYLGFLIYIWYKKGRDPVHKAIMPQYEPPKELTAAQAACLFDKGIKKDIFVIAFIQMLSSGFLKLTVQKEKIASSVSTKYILNKTGKSPENCEETAIHWDEISFDENKNDSLIHEKKSFEYYTKERMKPFYTTNRACVAILTMFMFSLTAYFTNSIKDLFIFYGWTLVVIIWPLFICSVCRNIIRQMIYTTVICIFMLPFICGLTYAANNMVNFMTVCFIALFSITAAIFAYLLYRPSPKGQALTEYLEGLYMFLKATKPPVYREQNPEKALTTESMEKLFPYAMALGLEKEWERKFHKLFGSATYQTFTATRPWMGSDFSSACSWSSTSRSSGSGGGGAAGGGCGGGGGGGR